MESVQGTTSTRMREDRRRRRMTGLEEVMMGQRDSLAPMSCDHVSI